MSLKKVSGLSYDTCMRRGLQAYNDAYTWSQVLDKIITSDLETFGRISPQTVLIILKEVKERYNEVTMWFEKATEIRKKDKSWGC